MILWTGWEVLVVVFIFGCQAAAYLISTHLSGDPDYIDLRVNRAVDRDWRDGRTGRSIGDRPRVFSLHPIRWCGGAMMVMGVTLCFYHLTPEQLWQSRQTQASRMEARPTPHQLPGKP